MNQTMIMAVGVTVGVALAGQVYARAPRIGDFSPDLAAAAGGVGYLMWKGSPNGQLGAFLDGFATGLIAMAGARFVPGASS